MKETNIVIPVKVFLYLALIALGIWLFLLIKNILLLLFLAIILAIALEPAVKWVNKKGVSYTLSVIIVAFSVVVFFVGLMSVSLIPFIQQFQILIKSFPQYIESMMSFLGFGNYIDDINQSLISKMTDISGNVVNATIGVLNIAIGIVTVIVFMIYLLLDFKNVRLMFLNSFKEKKRREVSYTLGRVEMKLGSWLRGQVLLMIIVGLMTYIGLSLLGVKYALALAVLAGLLEIVPLIGPVVAAIPALFVAFSVSPTLGIGVLCLYIIVQQLENQLIVPKVMNRVVGLNPLLTIIVILIGTNIFGFIGALLAVPTTIVILEISKDVFDVDFTHLIKTFDKSESKKMSKG